MTYFSYWQPHRERKTDNPELIKTRPRPVAEKESTDNVLFLAIELADRFKRREEMMKALQNKGSESYPFVLTDSLVKGREKDERKIRNHKNRNTLFTSNQTGSLQFNHQSH